TATLSDLQPQLDNAKNSNVEQLQADINAKQSVVDTVTKEIESAKADIELKVAREDATKSINSLKYIVAPEKADFTNQLNVSLTQDAINTIVTAAQAKDAANKAELDLKISKTNAVSEINGLKFLSDKQSFADKINASTTLNGVASVVSDANVADALVKTKEDAKSTIDGLKFLSNNVKSELKAKVEAATSKDDVDKLIASLQVVAVRFSVSGYNGNLIKTVPKRIGAGNYSVTLKTAKVSPLESK
ncbi:GA module-containing protein, partial [Leuconostoc mesenteroides]|uniref:GA module-containing protein n=1 Tax=Leuconostoc mesenteroides TaxID=1245 RepID=UPI0023617EC8